MNASESAAPAPIASTAGSSPLPSPARSVWQRVLLRGAILLVAMMAFGFGLRFSGADLKEDATPAGFGRGMLHGALMPCHLPYLLVGFDMKIYAANNSGRLYNLGYTVGVNLCGAVFFGFVFWRFSRWRNRPRGPV